MQLGIIKNSNEDYHSGPGISVSGLKLMAKSGMHYWSEYLDPNRKKEQRDGVFAFGTATHCALLEPLEFGKRFDVLPEGLSRRSKEGSALYDSVIASGKTPLRPDEHDLIIRTARSAKAHPEISRLLAMPHITETSLYWRMEVEVGGQVVKVLCKCRPDLMIEPCADFPNGLIFDLKTAESAVLDDFSRAAYRYQYHMQAAWYVDGFQQLYGTEEPPEFWFGVVEKEPPFGCRVYAATEVVAGVEDDAIAPGLLMLGRQEYQGLLDVYAECLVTDQWPGYPQGVTPLPLPGFAQKLVVTEEEIEVRYA